MIRWLKRRRALRRQLEAWRKEQAEREVERIAEAAIASMQAS